MLPPHEEFEIAICLQHSSALRQLNPIETCTIRSRDPMHQTFESRCLKQKLLQIFILKDERIEQVLSTSVQLFWLVLFMLRHRMQYENTTFSFFFFFFFFCFIKGKCYPFPKCSLISFSYLQPHQFFPLPSVSSRSSTAISWIISPSQGFTLSHSNSKSWPLPLSTIESL